MAGHWREMQKSFAVFVLTMGVLLLLLASTVVQDSQYSGVWEYLSERSHPLQRQSRQFDARSRNGHNNSNASTTVSTQAQQPVTDPPWMARSVTLVKPFVTNQSHPFLEDYVISNHKLCGRGPVDLLIVIPSSVTNFQTRRLLRETWAATKIVHGVTVKRVFVLGRSNDNVTQGHVNMEQVTYEDIVQGDFLDAFSNLTVKAVTALRWVNDHCLHARVVLKADDDMFVNVFALLEHVLTRMSGEERTVLCHAKRANTSSIVRDPKSKWFVPPYILPGRTHWPAFCSGYVVVMTTDSVPLLYAASFTVPYVPVDDAYVYGLLPEAMVKNSLRYRDFSQNLTSSDKELLAVYEDRKQPMTKVAGSARDDKTRTRLWVAVLERLSAWAGTRAAITSLHRAMGPTGGS